MLRVDAYESFKNRLFSGELRPGQFVTQRELATLANVSIGAVREAIQRLELESLVKVYPQRGIQITDISVRLIKEAYQLRTVLEIEAVQHFATAGDLVTIKSLIQQTNSVLERARLAITPDLKSEAVEIDWAMHDAIIDSHKNSLLSEAYRINAARIRLIRSSNVFSNERLIEVLTEHLDVLSACRKNDPDRAASVLQAHLNISRDRAMRGI